MKRQHQAIILTAGTILVISVFAVSVLAQGLRGNGINTNSGNRYSTSKSAATTFQSSEATSGTLSAAETKTLQYMLEEEKLAHDIYVKLYEKWGSNVFKNISNSETKHQNSLLATSKIFGVTDTRASAIGVFNNSDLQKLYDTLLAKGLQSQNSAYEVGKIIEEQDIADLQIAINESSSSQLDSVYAQLLKGSQNHLKAFTGKM